jgi:hypothetical protein
MGSDVWPLDLETIYSTMLLPVIVLLVPIRCYVTIRTLGRAGQGTTNFDVSSSRSRRLVLCQCPPCPPPLNGFSPSVAFRNLSTHRSYVQLVSRTVAALGSLGPPSTTLTRIGVHIHRAKHPRPHPTRSGREAQPCWPAGSQSLPYNRQSL